jgi:2,3-bisphosphoglycerate-independent phosphoglycerate mutase
MEKLKQLPFKNRRRGPVILCVMDGVGYGKYPESDAVASAHTPTLDALREAHPHMRVKAHGLAVGMPDDGDMGNSEVGHNAIGAGRVFDQGAKLVNEAIDSGRIFEGKTWTTLIDNVVSNDSTLHFLGLFSDGNVHAHVNHLRALIARADADGVARVRCHILLDGRDVGETSALEYLDPFEELLAEFNARGRDYRVASGGGRMYITMDRYNADWAMVDRGWQLHVKGEGRQFASAREAIVTLREETGSIDQDLPPFIVAENGEAIGKVQDGDSFVMTNFRGDRAMEMSNAFENDEFPHFDRGTRPQVEYAGMMQYDPDLGVPAAYLVEPPELDRTMGEFLAREGIYQMAISETQKFGHVTYFFNGNRSGKFAPELEDYIEVKSDMVPFYERPWMKAAQITDAVVETLKSRDDRFFVRMNYPNGDMIGHTGNYQAAEISVETVDFCISRLLPAVKACGGILVLCADHGNADEMYEHDKKTGAIKMESGRRKAKTSHSLNPVPVIIYDPEFAGEYKLAAQGDQGISSLAATCLNLLGFEAPVDYDRSLIDWV